METRVYILKRIKNNFSLFLPIYLKFDSNSRGFFFLVEGKSVGLERNELQKIRLGGGGEGEQLLSFKAMD